MSIRYRIVFDVKKKKGINILDYIIQDDTMVIIFNFNAINIFSNYCF